MIIESKKKEKTIISALKTIDIEDGRKNMKIDERIER